MVIQGKWIKPDVRGNVIKANRKAGIKLTDLGTAHIGGFEKNLDHTAERARQSLKPHPNLLLSMCTVTKAIIYTAPRGEEIAVPTTQDVGTAVNNILRVKSEDSKAELHHLQPPKPHTQIEETNQNSERLSSRSSCRSNRSMRLLKSDKLFDFDYDQILEIEKDPNRLSGMFPNGNWIYHNYN